MSLMIPGILSSNGAPPHWNVDVRRYLNNELPRRWIGHVGEDDVTVPLASQIT
jgi:hypothetical protein